MRDSSPRSSCRCSGVLSCPLFVHKPLRRTALRAQYAIECSTVHLHPARRGQSLLCVCKSFSKCRSSLHTPAHPLHTKDRHLRIGVTAKMIALKGPDGTPVFESIAITLVRRTARPLPTRNRHVHSCGCKSRVQVCEECLKSEHPEKYVSNLNRSQPASQPADNVHTQTHTTIPPKGALTSSPKCRGGFRAPKLRSFERCSQRCAQTLAPSRSHAYDTRIDVVHRTRP